MGAGARSGAIARNFGSVPEPTRRRPPMFPCCRSAMLGTRSALLAVVAITMLGPAGACKASEEAASNTKYDVIGRSVVRMGDLNLQKPADARALLQRLDRAAYQACGGD